MSTRNAVTHKLEAAIIVVLSTGLAIFGADRFERSGPDRELLRQLKEMQEARRVQVENADVHEPPHAHWNASPSRPLPPLAQH